MYEAKQLEHGLSGIQACVLRPDNTVDGPFSLTELPAPFTGRYVYNYPSTLSYPEGDYFAFVSSPMDETFTTYRFELFKPWATESGVSGLFTGGFELAVPTSLELPAMGSKTYQFFAFITAPSGLPADPDFNLVTITISNPANAVVVPLTDMIKLQTGVYTYTYTVNATDVLQPLSVRCDCSISSTPFTKISLTETFLPPPSILTADWEPRLTTAIDPGTDTLELLAWLTKDGTIIENATSAQITIYDNTGAQVLQTAVDSSVTSYGVFEWSVPHASTILSTYKAYVADVSITWGVSTYSTLIGITVLLMPSGPQAFSYGTAVITPSNPPPNPPPVTTECPVLICPQPPAEAMQNYPQIFGFYATYQGPADTSYGVNVGEIR